MLQDAGPSLGVQGHQYSNRPGVPVALPPERKRPNEYHKLNLLSGSLTVTKAIASYMLALVTFGAERLLSGEQDGPIGYLRHSGVRLRRRIQARLSSHVRTSLKILRPWVPAFAGKTPGMPSSCHASCISQRLRRDCPGVSLVQLEWTDPLCYNRRNQPTYKLSRRPAPWPTPPSLPSP